MQVEMEVANVNKIAASLASLGDDIAAIAMEAAIHEAEYELPLTQERVPVASGELKLSGRVEMPDFEAGTLSAGIAYGGPAGAGLNSIDVDYALPVHEDLEAKHPVGQAKYVESVVREELGSGGAASRMGSEIQADLALIQASSIGRFAARGGYWLRGNVGGRLSGSRRTIR